MIELMVVFGAVLAIVEVLLLVAVGVLVLIQLWRAL